MIALKRKCKVCGNKLYKDSIGVIRVEKVDNFTGLSYFTKHECIIRRRKK